MFALIDCNNFYASCERLFRPDLIGKPVIVLSNNDGCAIARSNEAKALGFQMGDPYFKIKALCKQHQVTVFSSNYSLYGDLSARVMYTISESWPEIEIYSIDEAFLDLSTLPLSEHTRFCEALQKRVLKDVGIPTSIGIGKTKTLAKLANHIAKKRLGIPVFNITNQLHWMEQVPVSDIWGIGRQWDKKLQSLGIQTSADLAKACKTLIKKRFNVVLQRTAYELAGLSCLKLEEVEPKQSIVSSKSFGNMQTKFDVLAEAVSTHIARAWEKMRSQGLAAQYLSVFILSNSHRKDLKQYSNSIGFKLVNSCDDVRKLSRYAKICLKKIYKPDIAYKKVGIMLDGLIPRHIKQMDLFHFVSDDESNHTDKLMETIEFINRRFGRSAVKLAAEGKFKPLAMRQEMKSPRYTTCWNELPIVHLRN